MIKKEEVFKIGMFNKPHGIHGELSFTFSDDVFDRADCDYLVCMMDGILVPFFVEDYRFRSETTALVKLEGVDSAEAARRFTNVEVYFPLSFVDDDMSGELSLNYLRGFEVWDTRSGKLGILSDIDDATINMLFVIETPDGAELLVPACEEFIKEMDMDARKLVLQLPDGLLQLDELEAEE